MSDPLVELDKAWDRVNREKPAFVGFRMAFQKGGLPAFSGPSGNGRGSSEAPLPRLDKLDQEFVAWDENHVYARQFSDKAYDLGMIVHLRLGHSGTDTRGRKAARDLLKASGAAQTHLGVMYRIMVGMRPLDASEARKLAEEAVSPAARTCANPFCGKIVERLEGERCHNCYQFWKRVGLERPEHLVLREIEGERAFG